MTLPPPSFEAQALRALAPQDDGEIRFRHPEALARSASLEGWVRL